RTLTRGRIALPDRALRLGGGRRIALPCWPCRRRQRTLPERTPLHAFGIDRPTAGRDRIGIHGRIIGKALHRTRASGHAARRAGEKRQASTAREPRLGRGDWQFRHTPTPLTNNWV